MTVHSKRNRIWQIGLHSVRAAIFAAILILIRVNHQDYVESIRHQVKNPDLQSVKSIFPTANTLAAGKRYKDSWSVRDDQGGELGTILETSPHSDHVVGFSGPTNSRINISHDDQIQSVKIVSSGDTLEHVEQVEQDLRFLDKFVNVSVGELSSLQIDGVSGATLTSLAIAESIVMRLSERSRISLKFPHAIALDEIKLLFPNATDFNKFDGRETAWHVSDANGQKLGIVIRSSPIADHVIGFQGPSDLLVGFDNDWRFLKLVIRSSYDNLTYVEYVKEDERFSKVLFGASIKGVAGLNPTDSNLDGVSGATMTSQAIVAAVKVAATDFLNQQNSVKRNWFAFLSARDLGTVAVILMAIVLAMTRLRGSRKMRLFFQCVLIGYLGLSNGDMLSQALLVGWAQTQIPWSTAFGLVVLSLAAILIPLFSGRNIYCSHVCPHGALQELAKKRMPSQIRLSPMTRMWMRFIPVALLVWCVVVAMLHLPFSLVAIEPFNAWVFRIAGWATIGTALVGLIASLWVPMAYCKYGCPTGSVLNFLRLNSNSHRWSRSDSVACCLLLLAIGGRFLGGRFFG